MFIMVDTQDNTQPNKHSILSPCCWRSNISLSQKISHLR